MVGEKRKQQGPPSNLFQGVVALFIHRLHQNILIQRITEYGGKVTAPDNSAITHIVFKRDQDVKGASKALENLIIPGVEPEVVQVHGHPIKLFTNIEFVTPEYFARSIAKGQLLNTNDWRPEFYSIALQEKQKLSRPSVEQPLTALEKLQRADTIPLSATDFEAAAQNLEVDLSQLSQQPTTLTDTEAAFTEAPTEEQPDLLHEGQDVNVPCKVERRGSEWIAVQGRLPRFTGGDTGIPWGSYGVWDEPYNEAKAKETLQQLKRFWYGSKPVDSSCMPIEQSIPATPPKGSNSVCSHIVCSKRPFCIIQGLKAMKDAYSPRDVFQKKAIDKAVSQLIDYKKPLDNLEDVDEITSIGTEKTRGKIREILATGHLQRVEALQAKLATDPKARALALFQRVWGAGEGVARIWFDKHNCQTIEEVLSLAQNGALQLTEQQRVGLKYFDDLEQRIPRAEVAKVEAFVRQKVFEAAEKRGANDAERTYVFSTGSYRRGAPDSGDIDFLICLPPSLSGSVHPVDFLRELLLHLLGDGLLLNEMNPSQPHHSSSGQSASWMGVCRPFHIPISSNSSNINSRSEATLSRDTVRRIDIKVYAHSHAPFAVNYFANSMSFCRATRFWAKNKCLEQAQKRNPRATGFKLSDKELVPIVGHKKGSRTEDIVLEPAVKCCCETDIFSELDLSYVPVTMRYFEEYH